MDRVDPARATLLGHSLLVSIVPQFRLRPPVTHQARAAQWILSLAPLGRIPRSLHSRYACECRGLRTRGVFTRPHYRTREVAQGGFPTPSSLCVWSLPLKEKHAKKMPVKAQRNPIFQMICTCFLQPALCVADDCVSLPGLVKDCGLPVPVFAIPCRIA
jgi:hypothetical protein